MSDLLFLRHLPHRLVSSCTAANGLEEQCPPADKKADKLKKKQKKPLEVQPEEATTEATPLKKKKKKRKLGDATEPPGVYVQVYVQSRTSLDLTTCHSQIMIPMSGVKKSKTVDKEEEEEEESNEETTVAEENGEQDSDEPEGTEDGKLEEEEEDDEEEDEEEQPELPSGLTGIKKQCLSMVSWSILSKTFSF